MTGPNEPGGAAAAMASPVSGVRVGVGLLLAVIVVLVILLDVLLAGNPSLRGAAPGTGLLLALVAAAAVREACDLFAAAGIPTLPSWTAWASFTLLALRALLPAAGVRPGDAAALSLVGLFLAVVLPVAGRISWRKPGVESADGEAGELRPLAGTALALLLVHLPMALLLELRLSGSVDGMDSRVPHGLALVTMAALACKLGDSAAYFAGRTVGRRPLCWVSPKKTWEGAVAGLLAGTAAAAATGAALGLDLRHGLAFGLVVNLAGQGGDLVESWVKRRCGAKDSGRTFGEMGGALDLVDALLLAGPAAFLFHRIVLA